MDCEICGNEIRGRGIKVVVEGATLTVCRDCAELGERVREEPRGRLTVKAAQDHQGRLKAPSPARAVPQKQLPTRKPRPLASDENQEIVENYAEIVRKARGTMTTEEFAASLKEKATVIQKVETGKLQLTVKLARRIEKLYRVKLVRQRDAAEDMEDVIWKPEKKSDYSPTLGDFIKEKRE
ncbi:MAG: TIGR00270 family protein [Candidatus Lokiarchaeota archaeon]|nr:TIGR00270 family protein [Candidatus Lokiarchaeota archaeon]